MPYQKPMDLPYAATGDRKQSSHKTFLLDVLEGFERIHRILMETVGPAPEDTGIIRFGGLGDSTALVEEQTVPNMTVKFNKALGFVNKCPFYIGTVTNSGTLAAPTTGNSRIDVVYIDPVTQSYGVETGVEDPSPVAPVIDETTYAKVAEILLTAGMSSITNDDITPTQNFYDGSLPPVVPDTYGTIYIPGGYMIPSADVAPSEGMETGTFGTNVLSYQVFDPATAQIAMFEFALPLDFDNSKPVNFRINWSSDDTSSASVAFDLFIVPAQEGASLDYTTVDDTATVNDNNDGTADERRVTDWSPNMTLSSPPGADCIARLQYSPETGDIENNIRVHSLTIRYTKLKEIV